MLKSKKISVEQFAKTGKVRNRRGQPVSASYLYRLIRKHLRGEILSLPFTYELTGEKDRIWVVE